MVEARYEPNAHERLILQKNELIKGLLKILYLTCYNLRQNTAHKSSI